MPVMLSSTIPRTLYTTGARLWVADSRRWVVSPPSSRMRLGVQPSEYRHWSIHHQKSSSDSPRHAKIGRPAREEGEVRRRGKRVNGQVVGV